MVVTATDAGVMERSVKLRLVGSRSVKSVTLGFDPAGGGYVSFINFDDASRSGVPVNAAEYFYGRGGQFALRDHYHSGRYNPTQAGFTDSLGAVVKVDRTDGGVRVPNFHLPLFEALDDTLVFDFQKLFTTGPNAVRSEFDGALEYLDATNELPLAVRIPALRIKLAAQFRRAPEAIAWFSGVNAYTGTDFFAPSVRVAAVSNTSYFRRSTQPGPNDLSSGVFAYLWRFNLDEAPFVYAYFPSQLTGSIGVGTELVKGKDDSAEAKIDGLASVACPAAGASGAALKFCDAGISASAEYFVVADGTNPDSSRGFGFYVPPTSINANAFYVWDDTLHAIALTENRHFESHYTLTRSTLGGSKIGASGQLRVGFDAQFSGVLNPAHLALTQGGHTRIEGLRHEVLAFFGTPREIEQAIAQWKLSH